MEVAEVLDEFVPTVHLRCGSDIFAALREAGFRGDFLEHAYPYAHGPVLEGPEALAARARFLVEGYPALELDLDDVTSRLAHEETELAEAATYERVVIWSEHDRWDQLMLVRVLAQFERGPRPEHLELVLVDRYPGIDHFRGLGQLGPAALRALWRQREPVTEAQRALGLAAWEALASPDPRALERIAGTGTPALPLLAPALRRHLAELPHTTHGLSQTEALLLGRVATGPASVDELFHWINDTGDTLPGLTDLVVLGTLERLAAGPSPALVREPGTQRRPWTDRFGTSPFGERLLAGEADWHGTVPPTRWVGGVRIDGAARPEFRWDPRAARVVATGADATG